MKFTGLSLLGLDLRGTNSGLEGEVHWRLVGLSLLGPGLHRFQSARRISTFYTSAESTQRVCHDEPTFKVIGGPRAIGDFSRGRPGAVGPAIMTFDPPVGSQSSTY